MVMRPHISLMLLTDLVDEIYGHTRNRSRFTELACLRFLQDQRFQKLVLKRKGDGARSQYTGSRRGRYTLSMARPVVDALDTYIRDEDQNCSRSHLIEVIMTSAVKDKKTRNAILHDLLRVEDPRAPYSGPVPVA